MDLKDMLHLSQITYYKYIDVCDHNKKDSESKLRTKKLLLKPNDYILELYPQYQDIYVQERVPVNKTNTSNTHNKTNTHNNTNTSTMNSDANKYTVTEPVHIIPYLISKFSGTKFDMNGDVRCYVLCTNPLKSTSTGTDTKTDDVSHESNSSTKNMDYDRYEWICHMICDKENPVWRVPTDEDIDRLDDKKEYNDISNIMIDLFKHLYEGKNKNESNSK